MGVGFESSGSLDKIERWLNKMSKGDIFSGLEQYAKEGVSALSLATPVDTGKTAASWQYRIIRDTGSYTIEWYNTNVVDGSVIAVLIQYGHGTGSGGYVVGVDYINPAIKPIFDNMIDAIVKEVSA